MGLGFGNDPVVEVERYPGGNIDHFAGCKNPSRSDSNNDRYGAYLSVDRTISVSRSLSLRWFGRASSVLHKDEGFIRPLEQNVLLSCSLNGILINQMLPFIFKLPIFPFFLLPT